MLQQPDTDQHCLGLMCEQIGRDIENPVYIEVAQHFDSTDDSSIIRAHGAHFHDN